MTKLLKLLAWAAVICLTGADEDIEPGTMQLYWGQCLNDDPTTNMNFKSEECCSTADHSKYAHTDTCRNIFSQSYWFQFLDLDRQGDILVAKWLSGLNRLHNDLDGNFRVDQIDSGDIRAVQVNRNSGDHYYIVVDNCLEWLTESQAHRRDAIRLEEPHLSEGGQLGVIKKQADGNSSLVFGMCAHPGQHPTCILRHESGRHTGQIVMAGDCGNADKKAFAEKYLARLYEVNDGAWIDPFYDIAIHYFVPQIVIVDPDTNDLYIHETEGNYWPSRMVIWKIDAARNQARLHAGHFDSITLTGKSANERTGIGGPATKAHIGGVYHMALHPITKELHFIGYPNEFLKVDSAGRLQRVDCAACGGEVGPMVYHKHEKQWILFSSGVGVFWQNGTKIFGMKDSLVKSYKNEDDKGPWNPPKAIPGLWATNILLDEQANELYCVDYKAGAILTVRLGDPLPEPTTAPTQDPTATPTHEPTAEPTAKPTQDPTPTPTHEPTTKPTAAPSQDPTSTPTHEPTTEPTADPTHDPTSPPTREPTMEPTPEPTALVGCYADTHDRDLPYRVWGSFEPALCSLKCAAHGFTYSGSQWKHECWCGYRYGRHGSQIGCNCDAPNVGSWRNCVFSTGVENPTRTGKIRSNNDLSKCLANVGDRVILQDCSSVSPNQDWALGSEGRIQAGSDPNKCVASYGGLMSPGTEIILWVCSSTSQDHLWTLTSDDMIQSQNDPTRCLAIPGLHGSAESASIILWMCSSASTDQKWTFDETAIV